MRLLWLALLFCGHVQALVVQGQASMMVRDAPLDQVRVATIKNAVADASYKSGSMITAEDVMLNGLLVSSKAELRTAGRIQHVEIVSETLQNDELSVVVNVTLTPLFRCESDSYARTVLVSRFALLNSRQAANGDLYDLGLQVSKRFENQLSSEPETLNVRLLNEAFAEPARYAQMPLTEIRQKANYLARAHGRQFVIYGVVRDIGLFEQVTPGLLSDDVVLKRNFTLDVYVLDTFRQSVIHNESYHSEANWDFDPTQGVDTSNSVFWRSDYGRVVLNTVNLAVTDIANAVACEPSLTPILDKDGDRLLIGLGRADGVSLNDRFMLYKSRQSRRASDTGVAILQSLPSYRFEVVEVNAHTAVLSGDPIKVALSGDLFDYVAPVSSVH